MLLLLILTVFNFIPRVKACPPLCSKCPEKGRTQITIVCHGPDIELILGEFPPSIVLLNIHIPNIKQISRDAFKKLQRIRILVIKAEQLTFIDDMAFSKQTQLMVLTITMSQITTISENIFSNLSNLIEITLKENQIQYIHPRAFQSTKKLLRLRLNSNKIRYLENGTFSQLTKLIQLQLQNNDITAIYRNTFEGLTSIKYLELTQNRIDFVEKGCFDFIKSSLLELHLGKNRISHFDDVTLNVLKVSGLFLGDNQMTSIHGLLQNVTSLKVLDVSNNRLSRIYKSDLKRMKVSKLILKGNSIKFISRNLLWKQTELSFFDISDNKITSFHQDTFLFLPKLSHLFLDGNELTEIANRTFWPLRNLIELHLSRNKLANLSSKLFFKSRKLSIINIAENQIESVHPTLFKGLVSLFSLNLSHNQISILNSSHLNPRIQLLYLKGNRIRTIDNKTLGLMRHLKRLDISENQIHCSCSFLDYIRSLNLEILLVDCVHEGRIHNALQLSCAEILHQDDKRLKTIFVALGVPLVVSALLIVVCYQCKKTKERCAKQSEMHHQSNIAAIRSQVPKSSVDREHVKKDEDKATSESAKDVENEGKQKVKDDEDGFDAV